MIGLSPRLSRVMQPVVQVVASFPAPMLFPVVVLLLASLHVSLGWGAARIDAEVARFAAEADAEGLVVSPVRRAHRVGEPSA